MEGVTKISDKAVEIAVSQLGQKEDPIGSNSGPMVDEYLKSVGLGAGYAWCQAFVYWCYAQAATTFGMPNPVVHTAGVLDCWNRTAVNIKIHASAAQGKPSLINVGDQIIFKHANGTGHTGIVERIERGAESGSTLIHTIEGNTNNSGSREGYEVERKVRELDDVRLLGFISY